MDDELLKWRRKWHHDTCYYQLEAYYLLYIVMPPLALMLQYRPYFPSSVKELAVFIDLAPKFQVMAEEVLQRQIQLVLSNLKQVRLWKQRYIHVVLWYLLCMHLYKPNFFYLIMLQFVIN